MIITEPGEATFRLGEEKPVGRAVATAFAPGLIFLAIAFLMAGEQLPAKVALIGLGSELVSTAVYLFLGSAVCHWIGRYVAGGEGEWKQMLSVYGFSFAVRFLDLLVFAMPRGSMTLRMLFTLWQGVVIVIGMKEVYGLSWGKAGASSLASFASVGSLMHVAPLYVIPFFQTPELGSRGAAIAKALDTPNLLVNPGFEDKELGTVIYAPPAPGGKNKRPASGFGAARPRPIRKGWHPQRFMPLPGVEYGRDATVFHSGKASAFVAKKGMAVAQPVMIAQTVRRLPKKGRIQASAWMKTQDVTLAMFMLGIIKKDGSLEQYYPKPLTGDHDWTQQGVAATLTADAAGAVIGFGMWGKGTVWVDDAALRTEFPPPAATTTAGPAATHTAAPAARTTNVKKPAKKKPSGKAPSEKKPAQEAPAK